MWFGETRVTVAGTAPISSDQALSKLRERLLGLGGTVEMQCGDTVIGTAQAYAILGKGYIVGTWYGKVPFRLRVCATSEAQSASSQIRIDCDLTAVLIRFLYVFAGLSVVVILPVAIKGWRQDPSLLLLLLFPFFICVVNFPSLRMVLPQKLRQAFQVEGLWWEA